MSPFNSITFTKRFHTILAHIDSFFDELFCERLCFLPLLISFHRSLSCKWMPGTPVSVVSYEQKRGYGEGTSPEVMHRVHYFSDFFLVGSS